MDEDDDDDEDELEQFIGPPSTLTSRKQWDDDFVLKSSFSALIPAFDPRPGRTNVPQIQDFLIPPPVENSEISVPSSANERLTSTEPKVTLKLTVKGPSLPGFNDTEMVLNQKSDSIFKYLHKLMLKSSSGASNTLSKTDRLKKIWEPTYT